jgi:hypothetical protein
MQRFFVAVVGLVIVGCAPPAAAPPTSTTTTLAPTTTTTLGPAESGVAFVECLRTEGVAVVEVAIDNEGFPVLVEVAASLDTTDPATRAAITGCASLLTSAQAAELAADPEIRLLVETQLAAFTACMRDRGIAEFPDPSSAIAGGSVAYPTDSVPFDAPGFDEALAECQEVLGSFGMGG